MLPMRLALLTVLFLAAPLPAAAEVRRPRA